MNQYNQYPDAYREEEEQSRRDKLRFAAGMSDFFGVILGAFFILILILLIISLLNWLRQDIAAMFLQLKSRV